MSKEVKKEVVVCDGKDKDNDTYLVGISSVYQGGPKKEGHFLKFVGKEGPEGLINDVKPEDKSKIKLETYPVDGNYQVCLIIDPDSDHALRLVSKGGTSSFTVEQNSKLVKAAKSYSEVTKNSNFQNFVFKKIPKDRGKAEFYLCSYPTLTSSGKSFFLAVGEDGKLRMNSPPEVPEASLKNHDDEKCLFRSIRDSNES